MEQNAEIPTIDLCEGVSITNLDYEKLCRNIWRYITSYAIDKQVNPIYDTQIMRAVLVRATEVLSKEKSVIDVMDMQTVIGPLYGQGDSLAALISLVGSPPHKSYVFLGAYMGLGFAPVEVFMLLLCFKVMFPHKITLLRGHHEDTSTLKQLPLLNWLEMRTIGKNRGLQDIAERIYKVCSALPVACVISKKILCMQGGPGRLLQVKGLKALRETSKPPNGTEQITMHMEAMWSNLQQKERPIDVSDGIPWFTEEQATKFCEKNGIQMLIRGKQLVSDGFLNYPKRVMTISSAVNYLDTFKNCAAAVTILDGKASIVRYAMAEVEPKTCQMVKPGVGRNAN